MKIAFYSYPSAFQNLGGGEVQLLKTKEALEAAGVEVKLFDQWQDRLGDFDLLHVFGSVKDCVGLMQTAKNKGVKIALSPIFWSSFKRAIYESTDVKVRADLTLRHFAKLALPYLPSGRRKTMVLADMLLPNSDSEARQIQKLFAISRNKMHIVPNGVDKRFKDSQPGLFISRFGIKNFALAVGRIEPRKNQLNLIKAFKGIDKDLVLIGNPVSDYPQYYQACKQQAGSRVHFLGGIPHDDPLLASAYAACDVFIAPGWFETPGLAALEAALAGTNISITKYGSTKDYFLDFAEYFDPSKIDDMRRAVLSACGVRKNQELQKHVYNNYTWELVAQSTICAYEKMFKE